MRVGLRAVAWLVCFSQAAVCATTVYLLTRSGFLYRTSDGAGSWQQVMVPGIGPSTYFSALAVDPRNPSNLYVTLVEQVNSGAKSRSAATTPAHSLFRSNDGGQSWSEIVLPTGFVPNRLLVDPAASSVVYATTGGPLSRSTDSGATFTAVTAAGAGVLRVVADPTRAGAVYALALGDKRDSTLYRSTDSGATWTLVGPLRLSQLLGQLPRGLAVDPQNANTLYAAVGGVCPSATINCQLIKSTDQGKSWQSLNQAGDFYDVTIDPRTNDIYASGFRQAASRTTTPTALVLKSSDAGKTWNALTAGLSPYPVEVYLDPNLNTTLYASLEPSSGNSTGEPLGIFVSANGGTSWTRKDVTPVVRASDSLVVMQVTSDSPAAPPPPPPSALLDRMSSAATLQDGPVAAESIVIATGARLATGSAAANYDRPSNNLLGTAVKVTDSAGVSRAALLFKVSPTQVTYQVPAGTAPGTASVTVTSGDGLTAAMNLEVAAVAPGLFTANAGGLAKGFVLRRSNGNVFIEDLFDIDGAGAVVARPITVSNGDDVRLVLYGTGFRAGGDFSATVGGVAAAVLYAGPQGVQPGMDQVNFAIPPEVGAGGPQSVPVVFTAAGQTANTVYVTVQ